MKRFKFGDMAITLPSETGTDEWNKRVGSVVQIVGYRCNVSEHRGPCRTMSEYTIKFDDGRVGCARTIDLRPIYDGNQKITWADCLWKPKDLEKSRVT